MRTLFEAIGAVSEEVEEVRVAEDLELLADFGANVGVKSQSPLVKSRRLDAGRDSRSWWMDPRPRTGLFYAAAVLL